MVSEKLYLETVQPAILVKKMPQRHLPDVWREPLALERRAGAGMAARSALSGCAGEPVPTHWGLLTGSGGPGSGCGHRRLLAPGTCACTCSLPVPSCLCARTAVSHLVPLGASPLPVTRCSVWAEYLNLTLYSYFKYTRFFLFLPKKCICDKHSTGLGGWKYESQLWKYLAVF